MRRLSLLPRRSAAVVGSAYARFATPAAPTNLKASTLELNNPVVTHTAHTPVTLTATTDAASGNIYSSKEVEAEVAVPAAGAKEKIQASRRKHVNTVELLISMAVTLQKKSSGAAAAAVTDSACGDEKKEATDGDATVGIAPRPVDPLQLLKALRAYIRSEDILAELCRSKVQAVRQRYVAIRARRQRVPAFHRDILLSEVTRVVERREVPYIEVARLLRPHWPAQLMDASGGRYHSFLQRSLLAWIAELLREGKLSPEEARSVLSQCPRLFHGHLSLMSSIVECALLDINTIQSPDPIIGLMWSVNEAGTHAPSHFWQRTVGRLAQLNRLLRDTLGDAMQLGKCGNGPKDGTTIHSGPGGREKKGEKGNIKSNNDNKGGNINDTKQNYTVGHVFSGLTTRQLFRVLRVLRKECWCNDVSTVYDFVDKALKNIAFEVEAIGSCEATSQKRPMSRQTITQRVKKSADLTPKELLSLLSIAGELGVDFHASLARTSDFLLAPMVHYLDREELLQLSLFVRKTRCDSLTLVQSIADEIVRRGVNYPLSVSLSKAALRTALQKPVLLSQLTLTPLVDHVISLCRTYGWYMRASQLLGWAEVLYDLSRRYAPSSSVGVNVRSCVEALAAPLRAMLEAGVVPMPVVSRFIELTVILGMRAKPHQYTQSIKLWEERNAAANARITFAKSVLNKESDMLIPMSELLYDAAELEDSGEVGEVTSRPTAELCRAARQVYDELIYLFEMQMIMRSPITQKEEDRLNDTFSHVGLYNIVVGARAMWRVHLQPSSFPSANASCVEGVVPLSSPHRISSTPPRALPVWVERRINATIEGRIRRANISATSTDEDVLRLFGQRHCNAAKVRHFMQLLMEESSLVLVKQQRFVWIFTAELARRFGGGQEQQMAQKMLAKVFC
ncbi:mitochondrial RNA binding protein 1 [Trypanosoma brucei equiperdum]|uniref:Mitochondrial RNA binding protein 1 n=1 Tax=Trypanosoma brucei equiperdum TaxID=630700 RepID=A0A3L6L280_9TRYP|nr:mitochondrial RNA binding protein 1 [Trypanosoma brucei equiperdum]